MNVDLVIKNAKVFINNQLVEAGLAIADGKIVGIVRDNHLPSAQEVFDAKGNAVLPGIIDVHVHFREPGRTEREDFRTGTESAACGGITTVVEMPTDIPYTSDAEALKGKISTISPKAMIDFALYGGVNPDHLDKIAGLAENGVVGYKVLMGKSTAMYPMFSDDVSLAKCFAEIAKTGLPASVHAETWGIIDFYTEILKQQGRKDPITHTEARPAIAEMDATYLASLLANELKMKVHIAHMSTEGAVDIVRRAKKRGQMITAETCPHYLLLKAEDMKKLGPYAKMNPPLRTPRDQDAMWKGLADGTLDIICTDHAPQLSEEKEGGWDDVWSSKGGLIGVETMLPLILTRMNAGRISLTRLVQCMSENPAKLFGLYPQKGAMQVGSDADLTIVNLTKKSVIKEDELHSKVKRTPFADWKVKGVPTATIVRGNVVVRNGEVVGKPGTGRLLRGGG
jgi:allantoinase